jgi:hypothetical protein
MSGISWQQHKQCSGARSGSISTTCCRNLASSTTTAEATLLLPQVCAAEVEPRHLAVAVHGTLKRTVPILGHAVGVDRDGRTLTVRHLRLTVSVW